MIHDLIFRLISVLLIRIDLYMYIVIKDNSE